LNPLLKKILIIGAPFLLRKLFRGNKIFKKIGLVLLVLVAGAWIYNSYILPTLNDSEVASPVAGDQSLSSGIADLYKAQKSGNMVSTVGDVTRILTDDTEGSRHQRFVITTNDGVSVLIAHNIDLAPTVPIKVGDQVSIHGQYEWNNKGGVLHWTHHDPSNSHPEGWIMHQGKKYD